MKRRARRVVLAIGFLRMLLKYISRIARNIFGRAAKYILALRPKTIEQVKSSYAIIPLLCVTPDGKILTIFAVGVTKKRDNRHIRRWICRVILAMAFRGGRYARNLA